MLGHFISDDPIFEASSPQEFNGYSYAADNPITDADPTGKQLYDPDTGCNGTVVTVEACIGQRNSNSETGSGSSSGGDGSSSGSGGSGASTGSSSSGSSGGNGCHYMQLNPCGKPPVTQPVVGTFFVPYFSGWWSSQCSTNLIGKVCTTTGVVATGLSGAQSYLTKFTPGSIVAGVNAGTPEEGMANANRILQMQNTATGLSRSAFTFPKLTSVGATRILGGVSGVAAYGYNYMTDRGEGQSRTRSAITSVPQAGADMYISATMAESGFETGAIFGSFIGPEGTVVGGAVGAVVGMGAGFVTSDITNNIISDVGSWFN